MILAFLKLMLQYVLFIHFMELTEEANNMYS
jgi:hypothetical protein